MHGLEEERGTKIGIKKKIKKKIGKFKKNWNLKK